MKKIKIISLGLVVAILVGMFSSNAVADNSQTFSDVQTTAWYNNVVSDMVQKGYLKGYPDGTFGPNKTISAAEFITILTRIVDVEKKTSTSNHWAAVAMSSARSAGWFDEKDVGLGAWDSPISRQVVAKLIVKALDLPLKDYSLTYTDTVVINTNYLAYVKTATSYGLYEGDDTGKFNPANGLTRAEACALIYRAYNLDPTKDTSTENLYDVLLATGWFTESKPADYGQNATTLYTKTLTPKNVAYSGLTVAQHYGNQMVIITLKQYPDTAYDSSGNFVDAQGNVLTEQKAFNSSGVFMGISGYNYTTRQFLLEVLKIAYPNSYTTAYSLVNNTILDKVSERKDEAYPTAGAVRYMDNRLFRTALIYSGDLATTIFIGNTNDYNAYVSYSATASNYVSYDQYGYSDSDAALRRTQLTTRFELNK